MTIQNDDKVKLMFQNLQEVSGLEVTMDCQVDKSEKTLVIKGLQPSEIEEILKKHDESSQRVCFRQRFPGL